MSELKGEKTAVLVGGRSSEAEISRVTGNAVFDALQSLGIDAVLMEADKDLPARLCEERIDRVFNALHGSGGEDGMVQGLLEWMQIPYTGSGIEASAIAMDKSLCKLIASEIGATGPKECPIFDWNVEHILELLEKLDMSYPLCAKPLREGSSVGVVRIDDETHLKSWATESEEKGEDPQKHFMEEYWEGRELTVSVLVDRALPLVEVRPKGGMYDLHHKYTEGATEYFCPPDVDEEIAKQASFQAVALHHRLGCRGTTRSDFILDDEDFLWFLELNTLPGMTPTSLLPKAAQAAGIDFEQLVEAILQDASLKGV